MNSVDPQRYRTIERRGPNSSWREMYLLGVLITVYPGSMLFLQGTVLWAKQNKVHQIYHFGLRTTSRAVKGLFLVLHSRIIPNRTWGLED